MRLLVTGGTGFIGSVLCDALVAAGHQVVVLTRAPQGREPKSELAYMSWEPEALGKALGVVDGVIHLAGEPVIGRRWTPKQKFMLQESRVGSMHRLIEAMTAQEKKPEILISASATGYYGPHSDETLTEQDEPGEDFLAQLCQAWEAEARRAKALGVRTISLRIGVVLGPNGGALAKMVIPFRLFVGGVLGSGRQWMPWIHREDVIRMILWILNTPSVSGPVNATSPTPVRMKEFSHTLAQAMQRPCWAPIPASVLRLLLGEQATILLTGQRVLPSVALRGGFQFKYPQLPQAIASCLAAFTTDD